MRRELLKHQGRIVVDILLDNDRRELASRCHAFAHSLVYLLDREACHAGQELINACFSSLWKVAREYGGGEARRVLDERLSVAVTDEPARGR